jgi:hypothetical protein
MRTGTSRGLVCLERDAPTTRFFDTLKSEHNEGRATVQRCVQAHERRLRGSTRPRPRWGRPRRGERQERIGRQVPGNSGLTVRIPRVRKPSKPGPGKEPSWQTSSPVTHNGTEGRRRREAELATGEGKPLKVETQGRYRHETRPGRLRAEQSVKRLRKPEDAAQPGEASPV